MRSKQSLQADLNQRLIRTARRLQRRRRWAHRMAIEAVLAHWPVCRREEGGKAMRRIVYSSKKNSQARHRRSQSSKDVDGSSSRCTSVIYLGTACANCNATCLQISDSALTSHDVAPYEVPHTDYMLSPSVSRARRQT